MLWCCGGGNDVDEDDDDDHDDDGGVGSRNKDNRQSAEALQILQF